MGKHKGGNKSNGDSSQWRRISRQLFRTADALTTQTSLKGLDGFVQSQRCWQADRSDWEKVNAVFPTGKTFPAEGLYLPLRLSLCLWIQTIQRKAHNLQTNATNRQSAQLHFDRICSQIDGYITTLNSYQEQQTSGETDSVASVLSILLQCQGNISAMALSR